MQPPHTPHPLPLSPTPTLLHPRPRIKSTSHLCLALSDYPEITHIILTLWNSEPRFLQEVHTEVTSIRYMIDSACHSLFFSGTMLGSLLPPCKAQFSTTSFYKVEIPFRTLKYLATVPPSPFRLATVLPGFIDALAYFYGHWASQDCGCRKCDMLGSVRVVRRVIEDNLTDLVSQAISMNLDCPSMEDIFHQCLSIPLLGLPYLLTRSPQPHAVQLLQTSLDIVLAQVGGCRISPSLSAPTTPGHEVPTQTWCLPWERHALSLPRRPESFVAFSVAETVELPWGHDEEAMRVGGVEGWHGWGWMT